MKIKKLYINLKKPYYLPNTKTICINHICQNNLKKIINKELLLDLPTKNYNFNNKTKAQYRLIGQSNIMESNLFNKIERKVYKYNFEDIKKLDFLVIDKNKKL